MTSDLLRAVERLRLAVNEHDSDQDECIREPKKRTRVDTQALKKELDSDLLTPQTSFDVGWLNKVQQCVTQPRSVNFC